MDKSAFIREIRTLSMSRTKELCEKLRDAGAKDKNVYHSSMVSTLNLNKKIFKDSTTYILNSYGKRK